MPAESEFSNPAPPGGRIKIHYIKSNYFRVIHGEGVTIEFNSKNGSIRLDVFSQRSAIPQQISLQINPDGTFGAEVMEDRISREGYVREVEVQIDMDNETAKSLLDGLQHVFSLLGKKGSKQP